jgi:GntR family transcriptional regulator, arabinose operon transcriptional repressor
MARRKTTSKLARPPASAEGVGKQVKHKQVYEYLHGSIQSGALKAGDRLPSEAELGEMFAASRITVAKAVLELQRMGLVTRRPGAGTHVLAQRQTSGYTFGLLIPELGLTEIFEPICHGMMRTPFTRPDALLWGNTSGSVRESAKEAEQMAQSYISQGVSGVFFAPLELTSDKDTANHRIARMLEKARIPLVLLDRCYLPYPERSNHDLVGIDNRRAGFLATRHLLKLGARKLVFLGEVQAAPTVDARITGFYEAMRAEGILPERDLAWRGSPVDDGFVKQLLSETKPEGIVCANDLTAARLMQTLQGMGIAIPEELRIVGIDDVKYANLLSVPLTTVHQDCAGIGALAMATMLERIEHPELPVRDVDAPIWLVERRSCGGYLNTALSSQLPVLSS